MPPLPLRVRTREWRSTGVRTFLKNSLLNVANAMEAVEDITNRLTVFSLFLTTMSITKTPGKHINKQHL